MHYFNWMFVNASTAERSDVVEDVSRRELMSVHKQTETQQVVYYLVLALHKARGQKHVRREINAHQLARGGELLRQIPACSTANTHQASGNHRHDMLDNKSSQHRVQHAGSSSRRTNGSAVHAGRIEHRTRIAS